MAMRTENAGSYSPLGYPDKLTIHWSAGNYTQTYSHYHFCVQGDGTVIQTLPIAFKGSHTWKRNSNNIGISMCCMADGYPPTNKQIERTAKLIAELVGIYNISWDQVRDHRYYAVLDGYENLRWDVGDYIVKLLAKAKWYREQIILGKQENTMKGKVK